MKAQRRLSSTVLAAMASGVLMMCCTGCAVSHTEGTGGRTVISLNGTWQIAEGGMDSVPDGFEHTVPVPGLVDMARPAFEEVGKKSQRRQAFWYRRTFEVAGQIPATAIVKIHKARYGTKVFLNGQVVGEHLPCFAPAIMDVRKYLKGTGQPNEILVRVGADRESLPEGMPGGWDFEKYLYIPGIYDSVELILAGSPHICNVQTVPDISAGTVRVAAEIANSSEACATGVICRVSEAGSGKEVGSAQSPQIRFAADERKTVEVTVPIENCRLWSPDDPFLYKLQVRTKGDCVQVRFGMRSFRFDPAQAGAGRAVLNGRPYFMRGTNVCIFRFFEDSQRADRPWRKEWVRRLHRKFKSMHWNSIRYCIGFPPEIWYEVADEEGFLIQDEFPIWLLDKAPENPVSEKIVPQYTEWMRERWNHPCVVIWDAQNESVTEQTGKAIQAVRHLDLSNRPWDNGWAEPQSPDDCVEAHPYLFFKGWLGKEAFHFREIASVSPVPYLRDAQKKGNVPIIINEYGWLWLNRDGTPTTLTQKIYESFFGQNSTTEQRRLRYARYLAAKTEFWRCHRKAAGVLHFCGLGYSRPGFEPRPIGGATSDHFIDLENLTFEPYFEQYVRDAFSPVGLMIDFWDEEVPPGAQHEIKVFTINDLYEGREGSICLRIIHNDPRFIGVCEQSKPCSIESLGHQILSFKQVFPKEPGEYLLEAELACEGQDKVRSLREFKVPAPAQ